MRRGCLPQNMNPIQHLSLSWVSLRLYPKPIKSPSSIKNICICTISMSDLFSGMCIRYPFYLHNVLNIFPFINWFMGEPTLRFLPLLINKIAILNFIFCFWILNIFKENISILFDQLKCDPSFYFILSLRPIHFQYFPENQFIKNCFSMWIYPFLPE